MRGHPVRPGERCGVSGFFSPCFPFGSQPHFDWPITFRQNFSFKCHREKEGTVVYAVNEINFHPTYGTFSTAGSDSQPFFELFISFSSTNIFSSLFVPPPADCFYFWDKDSRQRLKNFPKMQNTISATAFNRTGSIFAYAVSYDWSKVLLLSPWMLLCQPSHTFSVHLQGYEHYNPATMKNSIFLHATSDDEVKPRPKQK